MCRVGGAGGGEGAAAAFLRRPASEIRKLEQHTTAVVQAERRAVTRRFWKSVRPNEIPRTRLKRLGIHVVVGSLFEPKISK